jgi:hypothetical protein
MFDVNDPSSPIFIVLITALLLFSVYAVQGITRGRLPHGRTSIRGARITGGLAVISALLTCYSLYKFHQGLEFYGTASAIAAGLLFLAGITIAERIPD